MQHDPAETLELQARAGRSANTVLSAKIFMIETASTGLFGILKSPSITAAASDPVWVTFTLTDSSGAAVQPRRQVKIKIIKSELSAQREGDAMLLDMIDSKTCIGLREGNATK